MKLLLLLVVIPLAWASECSREQYWSDHLNVCLPCTKCKRNQIAIHPCGSHEDTKCSPAVQPDLDFPWLDNERTSNIFELSADSAPAKRGHGKDIRAHHLLKLSSAPGDGGDIYQDFLQSKHEDGKKKYKSNKKHKKHHYQFNQRTNDKFSKWEERLAPTNRPIRNRLVFDPYNQAHHHFSFPGNWEDDVGKVKGHRAKALHDQVVSKRKMKKIYDEKKLEEWLVLSEKELAQRKDDLLKNIKKDESRDNSSRKVKLNYPLYNSENELLGATDQGNYIELTENEKGSSTINGDVLKDLIEADRESKLEIETLLSNKKDSPYSFRGSAGLRQTFAEEQSKMSEMIGQVKIPNAVPESGHQELGDGGVVAAVPFTAVERFVWDWQELALISAVSACLLFFMVVTVYSISHSSYQQKRAKSLPYTADMEEMSTRIALMQPTLETTAEGSTHTKCPSSAVHSS